MPPTTLSKGVQIAAATTRPLALHSTVVQSYTAGQDTNTPAPLHQRRRKIRFADEQHPRVFPPPPPGAHWFRILPNQASPAATSRPIDIPGRFVAPESPKNYSILDRVYRGPGKVHLHRAEAGVKHDHFVSKGWRTVDPTKPLFHDWEVMLDRTKIVSGKEGTKIET